MKNLNVEETKELEKVLNRIIENSLFGTTTDPGWINLRCAADAFILLQMFELAIDAKDEIESILRCENICNENFLK